MATKTTKKKNTKTKNKNQSEVNFGAFILILVICTMIGVLAGWLFAGLTIG